MGIFVARTNSISAKKKLAIGAGEHQQETIGTTIIGLDEVAGEFADYNIYTMDSGGLKLVRGRSLTLDLSSRPN